MEKNTYECPLVTFALFAYNQEEYIREAIEGVFSQDCEPLEIILSDDCSSDRTFEIMSKMAREYRGRHEIKVRSTSENRGTFNHVMEVYREMSGQLMVLSAGDDISYPNRCSKIVDAWRCSGASVLFSKFDVIDKNGQVLQAGRSTVGDKEILSWFPGTLRQEFNHGATSAYHHSFFESLDYSDSPIYTEDAVFYCLAILKGLKIHKIHESLVKYRQSPTSISNDNSRKYEKSEIESFERKISWMASSYVELCKYVLAYIPRELGNYKTKSKVLATMRYARIRSDWLHLSGIGRCALIFNCRALRELRFIAPRLFGLSFFAAFKSKILKVKRSIL